MPFHSFFKLTALISLGLGDPEVLELAPRTFTGPLIYPPARLPTGNYHVMSDEHISALEYQATNSSANYGTAAPQSVINSTFVPLPSSQYLGISILTTAAPPITFTSAASNIPINSTMAVDEQYHVTTTTTTSSPFVWSTVKSVDVAEHLKDPSDIAEAFSSNHIGFSENTSSDKSVTWNTTQTAWDLLYELEERLQRVHLSDAPEYSGVLPSQFFDEPVPLIHTESEVPKEGYAPFIITDEEILAEKAIALSPYMLMPKDVIMYCYPFGEEEIISKCLPGMEVLGATGVYLPLMSEAGTERSVSYYNSVRTLKRTLRKDGKRYEVYGTAYDNPNWSLITQAS